MMNLKNNIKEIKKTGYRLATNNERKERYIKVKSK